MSKTAISSRELTPPGRPILAGDRRRRRDRHDRQGL